MSPQSAKKTENKPENKSKIAAPVAALLTALNGAGIQWCSWKSNQHLDAAVAGQTDLDLLFDEKDKARATEIFVSSGFKILTPAWFRTFPGMMDAFALCDDGHLIHAHCHFRFVMGEKYLKSFDLPWTPEILERRKEWEHDDAVYTSEPTDEMFLLLLREALKLRFINDNIKTGDEFFWLKSRVSSRALQERAAELLDAQCAAIMAELYDNGFDHENLRELQTRARGILLTRGWRRMNGARALAEQPARQFFSIASEIQTRFNMLWPWFKRRRTPARGLIIAVLGADGSGKSTVADKIFKGWSRKIDIVKIYLGRIKTPALLKLTHRKNKTPVSEIKYPTGWIFILRACLDASKKRALIHRAQILRQKGVIVIADRWPQNQFAGFNDGPLLSHLKDNNNKYKRKLATWEARQFETFSKTSPDLVIRLSPSLNVALARKPGENSPEYLQMKIDTLKNATFGADTKTCDINADKELNNVIAEARHLIWNEINA